VRADWHGHPDPHLGHRRHAQEGPVTEKLEKLSVADGLRAVRFAEVVVVLLDVEIPFEVQDLRIADFAETEGRAVVVAVNKWDLEDEKQEKLAELKEMFERLLPQLRGAPLVTVSAKTGRGLDRLHDAILRRMTSGTAASRPPAEHLAGAMTEAHPPPAPGGHRIKLRYITQAKTRPPGFVVKCSRPEELPESYKRYLVNGLRDHFDMPGTPIRLFLRGQGDQNPFRERKFHTPSRLRKHLG
jgi:GTP-binding protein